jgi:hypothetical protein
MPIFSQIRVTFTVNFQLVTPHFRGAEIFEKYLYQSETQKIGGVSIHRCAFSLSTHANHHA